MTDILKRVDKFLSNPKSQTNFITLALIQGLVEEVKKLRKALPKDDRNLKEWRKNFEWVWEKYPEKKGKHAAWLSFKNQVKDDKALADIVKALANYKADMANIRKDHPERPWLHGSTWFNHRWEDFISYKAPGVCAVPYTPNKIEPPKVEECVDPKELQKMVKKFNRGLKPVPKASTKFVE